MNADSFLGQTEATIPAENIHRLCPEECPSFTMFVG
jgi:hypothetical protein